MDYASFQTLTEVDARAVELRTATEELTDVTRTLAEEEGSSLAAVRVSYEKAKKAFIAFERKLKAAELENSTNNPF